MPTLSDLEVGQTAVVSGYASDSQYAQRLAHLGLISGTRITLVRRAPLGDPVEIRCRGVKHCGIRTSMPSAFRSCSPRRES